MGLIEWFKVQYTDMKRLREDEKKLRVAFEKARTLMRVPQETTCYGWIVGEKVQRIPIIFGNSDEPNRLGEPSGRSSQN